MTNDEWAEQENEKEVDIVFSKPYTEDQWTNLQEYFKEQGISDTLAGTDEMITLEGGMYCDKEHMHRDNFFYALILGLAHVGLTESVKSIHFGDFNYDEIENASETNGEQSEDSTLSS